MVGSLAWPPSTEALFPGLQILMILGSGLLDDAGASLDLGDERLGR